MWTATGTIGSGSSAFEGLTGYDSGGVVTLFATEGGTQLVSIVDSNGYEGTLSATPTVIATAATDEAFRGVALAPSTTTATSTALTSSGSSTYGTTVTFTATVTATAGTAPGTVTFMDGTTALGTAVLNTSGVATFSTSALAAGTSTITAVYDGVANAFSGSTSSGVSQVVSQAALTISADDLSSTYRAALPTLLYTASGLVNGDTISGALATTATSSSSVGTYSITQGTLSASSNYTITFNSGILTIAPAGLTITADDQSSVYGSALPSLTYTSSGLVNGDTISGALATTATSGSAVGTYPIAQGTLSAGSNYTITFNLSLLTITASNTRQLVWTDSDGNGLWEDANNWVIAGTSTNAVPSGSDAVYLDGTGGSMSDGDCIDAGIGLSTLYGLNITGTYTGTVTLANALLVSGYQQTSGSLAQPVVNPTTEATADLTVLGNFTWTGGTLNSTPNNANVNIDGGGSIGLATGGTLTTGSALNFGNIFPASGLVVTTISGSVNLLLNGASSNALSVTASAEVDVPVQVGSPGAVKGVDNAAKTLTLGAGAAWGYIGTGASELDLQVINNGGTFFLGSLDPKYGALGLSQVTISVKSGANTTAYTQQNANAALNIMNGCVLDVSATKGVAISAGTVLLVGNSSLTSNNQRVTIKGNYLMSGGVIGFVTPTQASDNVLTWGSFTVDGDVTWSGGQFNPGLDCIPGDGKVKNKWFFTGTMTILSTPTLQPIIAPIPQFLPAGQQPKGTWDVILAGENGSVKGANPGITQGWTLLPVINANGVTTGYRVDQ